ncbi:TPA: hypothetical protein ACGO1T_000543 [Streptococcus suis]
MIEILSPKELLDFLKNNSRYAIEKETGIRQTTLSNYANGATDVIKMSLDNAIKITNYATKMKEENKMMETRYETVKQVMDWESNDGQIEFFAHGETVRIPEEDMIEELQYSIDEDGYMYDNGGSPADGSDLVEDYLKEHETDIINQLVDLIDWEEVEAKSEASIRRQINEVLEDDENPIFRDGGWDIYYQPNFTEVYWVERGMAYDGPDRYAYQVAIVDDGEVRIN